MKIVKVIIVALAAMLGLSSCDNLSECNHDGDIAGTWTCNEPGYAEALVINEDGSVVSYGVEDEEYWENVAGHITVENNTITMTFEDQDNFTGHFDIIPGVAFSISNDEGERYTYYYCSDDFSDEILGMWIVQNNEASEMSVNTYKNDGTVDSAGYHYLYGEQYEIISTGTYKVVGDMVFESFTLYDEHIAYASRMVYTPNGSSLGDTMTQTTYFTYGDETWESAATYIRVKQSLNLTGKKYFYSDLYITNVEGIDQDIEFMGGTFNFANMDGSNLDMTLKSLLFNIEFPDSNTLTYSYKNSTSEPINVPVVVDGNKITVKMTQRVPTLKDVELYTFQDVNDSQMHIYMHKNQFVNFFTNMKAMLTVGKDEQFDINDPADIEDIYTRIDAAVQSINLSVVLKAAK